MKQHNMALHPSAVLQGKEHIYRIERVLGQGSFGITYLAKTQMKGELGAIEVPVAVKEFFMRDLNSREGSAVSMGTKGGLFDNYRKKFAREARNLGKLSHPGIVKVFDTFEANGTAYYAMEYIDGGSLDALIEQRGGLSEDRALSYFRQIAGALVYMHRHRMLHLDLKPGNIMLRSDGEHTVLIDFGLSKQYDEEGEPESSTTIGGGTLGYAPIEQINYRDGHGFPVTMDVYALGGVLYKMLTGQRPPASSELLVGFPEQPLMAKGVCAATIACIRKAMSPIPADRYASVEEFAAALSRQDREADATHYVEEPRPKVEQLVASEDVRAEEPSEPYDVPDGKGKRNAIKYAVLLLSFMVVALIGYKLFSESGHSDNAAVAGFTEAADSVAETEMVALPDALHAEQEEAAVEGPSPMVRPESSSVAADDASSFRIDESNEVITSTSEANHVLSAEEVQTADDADVENVHVQHVREETDEELFMKGEKYYSEGDYKEAVKWYQKAAERGFVDAQITLGTCYAEGKGVPQNYQEAIKWYTPAAVKGNATAQFNLAFIYDEKRDYVEAAKMYKKAADQGLADAQFNLGCYYAEGKGVPQDYQEAIVWYYMSAEQGNASAQCNLGFCYANGLGINKNDVEAVKWYKKSAEQGNATAQFNLGLYYRVGGKGVKIDFSESFKWYKKSAEQGNADAQYALGLLYKLGALPVQMDLSEAVKWFRKAAEQGDASAQEGLGDCYRNGLGVPRDLSEAVKWYRKAARQGDEDAQTVLKELGYDW